MSEKSDKIESEIAVEKNLSSEEEMERTMREIFFEEAQKSS